MTYDIFSYTFDFISTKFDPHIGYYSKSQICGVFFWSLNKLEEVAKYKINYYRIEYLGFWLFCRLEINVMGDKTR